MNHGGKVLSSGWSVVLAVATAAGCVAPEEAVDEPGPADEALGAHRSELRSRHRRHPDRCRRRAADVPAAIAVPADSGLKAWSRGWGVQIYGCTAGAWVLKAPEADLLDERGHYVGNHFLGPVWQWRDGSKLRGTRLAQAAAPDPSKDIPWLLLSATDVGGDGQLERVTHIQRLRTVGGVAPPLPCAEGAESRVAYAADYLFYRPRAGDER